MGTLQHHTDSCNLDQQLGQSNIPPEAKGYKEITGTVAQETIGMLVTSREDHKEYSNPTNSETMLPNISPTVNLLKTEDETRQQVKTYKPKIYDKISLYELYHLLEYQDKQNSQHWKRENILNEFDVEKMLNDLDLLEKDCDEITSSDMRALVLSSDTINDGDCNDENKKGEFARFFPAPNSTTEGEKDMLKDLIALDEYLDSFEDHKVFSSTSADKSVAGPPISYPPGLEILRNIEAVVIEEQNAAREESNEESESKNEKSKKNEKKCGKKSKKKKAKDSLVYYSSGVKKHAKHKKKKGCEIFCCVM